MSDEQDEAQKTEDPTPKKLEEARKKGNIPLSREVNNWLMLLTGTILVASFFPYMFEGLKDVLKYYIENSYAIDGSVGSVSEQVANALIDVLRVIALPMLFLLVAAFFGPFHRWGLYLLREL